MKLGAVKIFCWLVISIVGGGGKSGEMSLPEMGGWNFGKWLGYIYVYIYMYMFRHCSLGQVSRVACLVA